MSSIGQQEVHCQAKHLITVNEIRSSWQNYEFPYNKSDHHFFIAAVRHWNRLPTYLKTYTIVSQFKNKLSHALKLNTFNCQC